MSPDLKDLFDDAGRTPPAARGYDADDVVRRGGRIRTRRRVLTGAATLAVAAVVVGGSIALIGQPLNQGTAIQPGGSPTPSLATPKASVSLGTPNPSPDTPTQSPIPHSSSTNHACTGDEVTLTLGQGDGAAGTTYYPVLVKAKPDRSCTVLGTPIVYALQDIGLGTGPAYALIGPAFDMSAAERGSVLVQGASVASFLVGIGSSDNYDAAVCLPVPTPALRVTLPDAPIGGGPNGPSIDVPLPNGVTVCSGNVSAFGHQLTVNPIVAGPDGQ